MQSAGKRNVALDGIRGLAIALVVFYHAFGGVTATSPWTAPVVELAGSSWIGVDLFFVLSGFLITGTLVDTRDRPGYFRIFYARRFLRIFPLYYSFLFALFLIGRFHVKWRSIHLLWHVFYLSNVSMALRDAPNVVAHLWSLSVEEQFYLIWPSVIFLIARPRHWRSTLTVIGALLCALIAGRQIFGLYSANNYVVYGILHLDGLLLGAALAVFYRCVPESPRARLVARAVIIFSAGILVAEMIQSHGLNWWDWRGPRYLNYTLIAALGTALIALTLYSGPQSGIARIFAWRPLGTLGKYSYAMYVLHTPINAELWSFHLQPSSVAGAFLYTLLLGGISLAGAVASWNILEKRCLELKDRWFSYPQGFHRDAATLADLGQARAVASGSAGD